MKSKGEFSMIINKKYSGLVTSLKIVSKAIKTPEEEKIQKRVGIIKTETEYTNGDLKEFIDGPVPDDILFSSVSWDERIGEYKLIINELEFPVKILKIERKNKTNNQTCSFIFETEDLTNLSTLGNYVKDKDNPSQIKLEWLQK